MHTGRYTTEELRQIDTAASSLGIELVPCIQTLGHLSQILQWPRYDNVRDQQDVLLADYADTYAFIGQLLDTVASTYSSRRIHIGTPIVMFLCLV